MTEERPAATGEASGFEIRLGTLLWFAAGGVFLVFRVAGLVSIPLGGAELDAVSGAWQASIGIQDDRFIPTLFQAVTALMFQVVDTENWPRVLAVCLSATIPFALYRLRQALTEPGALIALVLLAFDAPGILLDSTANVSAFDVPLALGLLALMAGNRKFSPTEWVVLGFLVSSAGPIPLTLALASIVVGFARQEYPAARSTGFAAAGAVAAVLLSSFQYGLGWDGLRIAPLEALAASFDGEWSTEPARSLVTVYLVPLILVTIPSVVWTIAQARREEQGRGFRLVALAWLGLGSLWLLASFGEHTAVPLAAFSLPAALIVGPAISRGVAVVLDSDWTWAGYLVPAGIGALFISLSFFMDWARNGSTGDAYQQVAAWGMLLVAIGCVALIVSNRPAAPTAALLAVPFLLFPHIAGVSGVAFGGPNEPMPSPISPVQAREIRDIAVTARGEGDGDIVIHPRFERELAWPFRNSGEITIATQPTLETVVLVWPTDAPRPEGFAIVEGEWALLRERTGPEGDWLDYLRWYFNRNTLGVGSLPVSVYLRSTE